MLEDTLSKDELKRAIGNENMMKKYDRIYWLPGQTLFVLSLLLRVHGYSEQNDNLLLCCTKWLLKKPRRL